MKITQLRTNHLENPIGYAMDELSFSWIVEEATGTKTTKAVVRIAEDEAMEQVVFEKEETKEIHSCAFSVNFAPEEKTRYYWNVTVEDENGETATSETCYFETAPQTMGGKWIQSPFEKKTHVVFQKGFALPEGQVKQARLYIIGLGVFECYINGEKVGNEYLAPFYQDYNNWLQFETYDVTKMLSNGKNAIGVMLGNGWYKGRFGFIENMDRLYGDTLVLRAALEVTMADGNVVSIPTDDTFLCAPSPVLESSIYDGEVFDARAKINGFATIDCDLSTFKPAIYAEEKRVEPSARRSLPLTIQEEIKPIEIIHTPAGETVLDFGQNLTGLFRFTCNEPEGTEIHLQFGEILQDENFYNDNLRSAKEAYTYISDGVKTMVRPHFTFYGYRYVKVEGIVDVAAADFCALVLHSEMAQTGTIVTSNDKVNQLVHNALWGQKGNFVDVPTDCPQRDERMGWTGDAQVFSATASFNMYTPAFYDKFLYDMRLEQEKLDGAVPHVVPDILDQINDVLVDPVRAKELGVPTYKEDNGSGMAHAKKNSEDENADLEEVEEDDSQKQKAAGSCAWGDAATVIPWTMYQFYGDKEMLARQYANMKMWTDYIIHVDDTKCKGRRLWHWGFHFADWLALDSLHPETCLGGTDSFYVASAYYLYSAGMTAKAAKVLGKEEEAAYYDKIAEEVRKAMQDEYFTKTGRLAIDTQTAMVLALYFDIVPEEFRPKLVQALVDKLEAEKVHLTTGFVGTPYLCPALSQNGMSKYAYTLLLNEDYPSWLYEVNMGATTIWERWNSVLPDGRISDTGMNSLNHYSYGSIAEWMYRYMCGLNPVAEAPGFKKFMIKPYPDTRFANVAMTYDSAYGTIASGWEYDEKDNVLTFHVKVPFDTTAKFELSDAMWDTLKVNGIEALAMTVDGVSVPATSAELICGTHDIVVKAV